MTDIDIAIIGGGIAGLSAAVALNQIGRRADVFETAPAFTAIGTSLSLWPNAMACLADWGLHDHIANDGAAINSVAWRQPNRHPYLEQPMSGLYDAIGFGGVCVRRADLHRHQAGAIPRDQLHTSKQLTSWTETPDGVTLTFADHTTVHAKHVIAADGIWSQLRAKTLDDGPPVYSGYGAWLGFSTAPAFAPTTSEGTEYMGPNGRFGIFETGQDTRYWFFVAKMPPTPDGAQITDTTTVSDLVKDWPPAFHEILAQTAQGSVTKVGFYDRPVSRTWGHGNITIIGDAIHPILPNLGQGACQSIEDAHVLAAAFAAGKTGPDVTRWMETKRFKRLHKMQRTSRQVGAIAQTENAFTRTMRRLSGKWPLTIANRRRFMDQFTR